MNANELADWFDGRILYLWDAEDGQYYDSAIASEIVPTLRQQQVRIKQLEETQDYLYKTHDADKAEIEFLKKEILEKHEDWKHEGQQAANARAEIEALKATLSDLIRPKRKVLMVTGETNG